jgi:hypothetical protein
MNCRSVPAEIYTLYADNGDPLLLYGKDAQGFIMLWPTRYIEKHPIAFGRWCWRNVHAFRGCRMYLRHAMTPVVQRWASWLKTDVEAGVI